MPVSNSLLALFLLVFYRVILLLGLYASKGRNWMPAQFRKASARVAQSCQKPSGSGRQLVSWRKKSSFSDSYLTF